MSKQDNLNFLKIQSCVLKVNVHCEGCKKKVKKLLQKIDGVYTVSVDAEHGKVTVSGTVDPSTLIKRLAKSGKPAELLGPKGGCGGGCGGKNSNSISKNPSKGSGNGDDFLSEQLQKLKLDGGKTQLKGQKDVKLPQATQLKGLTLPSQKDQKNVKFSPPEDLDDESDFDDLDDDEFYDDDDLDSIYDDLDMKPAGNNKGGKENAGGGGSKEGKKGDKNGDKKGSEKSQGPAMGNNNNNQHQHQKMVGQGVTGVPAAAAAAANPYQQMQQQQYMQQMMRQQQQQQMMMMNGPTVYGQPMGYMPAGQPVYGQPPYANYFSDENTGGCSIM